MLYFLADRAWFLALIWSSWEVIQCFIENGMDITLQDGAGNNCIHILIYNAYFDRSQEIHCSEKYHRIMQHNDIKQRNALLNTENRVGMRPLELASFLGTLELAKDILNTEGVYVSCRDLGAYTLLLFDITEYESFHSSRKHLSPIYYIMLIEKEAARQPLVTDFIKSELVLKWVNAKRKVNLVFLRVWFLCRMLYVAAFFICMWSFTNEKDSPSSSHSIVQGVKNYTTCMASQQQNLFPGSKLWQEKSLYELIAFGYLLLFTLCSISCDVMEALVWLHKKITNICSAMSTPKGRRDTVLSYWYYRLTQLNLALGALFMILCHVAEVQIDIFVHNQIFVLTAAATSWTIVYFVQTVPLIGLYAVILQRMLTKIFTMSLIFVSFLAVYATVFHQLVNQNQIKCAEDFKSIGYSMYGAFKVMLNLVDFTQYSIDDHLSLILAHFRYFFEVNIMMINFLIALFAYTLDNVMCRKKLFETVQKLNVVLTAESRVPKCLASYVKRRQKQEFFCEKGRISIPVVCIGKPKDIIFISNKEDNTCI